MNRLTAPELRLLREMIDAKKRDRLANQESRFQTGKPGPRAAYWREYYAANRTRILALRKARRER